MRSSRTRQGSRQRADFIAALVKAGFPKSRATSAWRLFNAKNGSDQPQRHDDEQLLRYRDAARFLSVSEGTLRNWIHRKQHGLPVIKLGLRHVRFRRSSLVRWLQSRERDVSQLVAAGAATSDSVTAAR
jgi:excisionase family DNA binding protein